MDTVNYGIVGCGMMGMEHIENIGLLPHGQVSAVLDPVPELAQEASRRAGGARVAQSMPDLLDGDDVDALVIVSPNHLHVDQLFEISTLRHLPILCEKPLFTNPEQGERIKVFRDRYQAPIWVAMEYRYMPPIAAFLDEVEAATGGIEMLTIREHRFPFLPKIGNWNRFNRNTGGTLVEKCCHHFDIMCLAMQSEPVRVMASGGQAVNHTGESYAGEVPDIWDNAFVIVDFANGKRAMLDLCMFAEGSHYQEEITAVGRDGKIECLVPGPGRFWPDALGPAPVPKLLFSPRSPKNPSERDIPVDETLLEAGDHNGSTFYQHERFNAVVRGQGQVEVTLTDGARAVEIALAAQQSAIEGRTIELPVAG
ncbi:Gfo/Idh/MocA family protein [Shimia ponticola]|uniref:Gfo/Idh/MocA family protein n=1 Tax=Shimia ponticola TaxID=2582893 RepID=UPI0011BEFF85|nr:Gfo/Idh/MocA family oxidoreductase [Shimia ponticola]